jgi:hypothetical protein
MLFPGTRLFLYKVFASIPFRFSFKIVKSFKCHYSKSASFADSGPFCHLIYLFCFTIMTELKQ